MKTQENKLERMQFYICKIDIIYLAHTWRDNIVLPWEDTELPFFGQLY